MAVEAERFPLVSDILAILAGKEPGAVSIDVFLLSVPRRWRGTLRLDGVKIAESTAFSKEDAFHRIVHKGLLLYANAEEAKEYHDLWAEHFKDDDNLC